MKERNKIVVGLSIVVGLLLISPKNALGQGCPACSNPALQSSEKLEAGLDTLYKRSVQNNPECNEWLQLSRGASE